MNGDVPSNELALEYYEKENDVVVGELISIRKCNPVNGSLPYKEYALRLVDGSTKVIKDRVVNGFVSQLGLAKGDYAILGKSGDYRGKLGVNEIVDLKMRLMKAGSGTASMSSF